MPGFFRCKSSQILHVFIALSGICDNIPDCPLEDDEYFSVISAVFNAQRTVFVTLRVAGYEVGLA